MNYAMRFMMQNPKNVVYLSEEVLVAIVWTALPVEMPIPDTPKSSRTIQLRYLLHKTSNVKSACPLRLAPMPPRPESRFIRFAEFTLRRETFLSHPGAQHRLYKAEELLHVRLQVLSTTNSCRLFTKPRPQTRIRAHLKKQIITKVNSLVPPPPSRNHVTVAIPTITRCLWALQISFTSR